MTIIMAHKKNPPPELISDGPFLFETPYLTLLRDRYITVPGIFILTYVHDTTSESGVCFASNDTIGYLLGMPRQTVANQITRLVNPRSDWAPAYFGHPPLSRTYRGGKRFLETPPWGPAWDRRWAEQLAELERYERAYEKWRRGG